MLRRRPEQIYQGYVGPWLTWYDWLGLPEGHVAPAHTENFLPFARARSKTRALGLKSHKAWIECVAGGGRPEGVPANPDAVYRAQWKSWSDWLACPRGWC